ncbi:L-type lectin-domain containing receptor kinase IX.1-like [Papaver somniferum]|uniref:L-type lectin-domain containing receptor kinase IX.1-like n=1 Tax=Papaver somniferum TaxID=3469 RepID=UPI000E6F6B1E|nr:L-type lectin-domain containing receptor kinase IX.1-like [Papaver somniferum]
MRWNGTTNSISFNFPNFHPNERGIHYENDSTRNDNLIDLTKNSADDTNRDSVGRATYSQPIQLWDETTGRITDFVTHFSFIIKGLNETSYGDGMAFFLAPFESDLPPNSHGGSLGLLNANVSQKNLTTNQIVAVELDNYKNSFDHISDHVGIDVNSIVSVATKSFAIGSIRDGRKSNAWVSYNSTTKNLSVFLTYDENPVFNGDSTLFYIVDLSKILPEQIRVGFSAATGWGIETHKVLSWQFNSTLELIDARKHNTTDEGQTDSIGKGNKTGLAVGLGVGLGVLGCGVGFALFIWFKKRRGPRNFEDEAEDSDMSMDDAFEKGTGPKKFSYSELVLATNNFDEGGKLGQGGFGGVYKGLLSDLGLNIAVKRVSKGPQQGKKEYQSEVKIISQLRHKNLVQLIGWCHKRNELLLVYEFMPNRSLGKHLFQGENALTWEVRYKISLGLASALLYLHEEWEQCVVHRDIKSSNVMLDSNFNAKLGDFGLARLVDHDLGSQTTVFAGTMGYLAPECIATGKSSKESDVYSFGIVALEIACRRKPVEGIRGVLVEWVWELYGSGKIIEVADHRLNMEFDEKQMENLMVPGLWCAHPDHKSRPSIRQVINVLNFESPLPILPSKLPTPVYYAPPIHMFDLTSTSSYGGCRNSQTNGSQCTCSSCSNANSSQMTMPSAGSSPSKCSFKFLLNFIFGYFVKF